MIEKVHGDVRDAEGLILHCVNCQGVMGSGVAKDLRDRWPIVFSEYRKFYEGVRLKSHLLGEMQPVKVDEVRTVINIFGQQNYGKDKQLYLNYYALAVALKKTASWIQMFDLEPVINFPLIGCGTAGGDWNVVSELIEKHFPNRRKVLWLKS